MRLSVLLFGLNGDLLQFVPDGFREYGTQKLFVRHLAGFLF